MELLVFTKDQLNAVVDAYMEFDEFCVDVETWGDNRLIPQLNDIFWIQLSGPGRVDVIPMGHPNGNTLIQKAHKKKNKETGEWDHFPAIWSAPPKQLLPGVVFEALRRLFFSTKRKIGQNLSFDILSMSKYYGELIPGPYADIIHSQWMINENILDKRLGSLVKRHFHYEMDKSAGKALENYSFADAAKYCYLDGKIEWLLFQRLEEMLPSEVRPNMLALERDVFSGPVMEMQYYGVDIDIDKIKILDVELQKEKVRLESNIYSAVGRPFSLTNDNDLRQAFYTDLKLKPKAWTAGGKDGLNKKPSVAQPAIKYYEDHPVVHDYLEWAKIDKLHSTYVLSYLGSNDSPGKIIAGHIHGQFLPWGTVTGRFSSREPNLQNVPAPGSPLGKAVRSLFIAPQGFKFVVADYGQVELLILAHYCRDPKLTQGFYDNIDAHTMTAAMIFGVDPSAVTSEMRKVAKALNFAVVYGAGAAKVAAMTNTNMEQAKAFLAKHSREFPQIHAFKGQVIREMRRRTPPYLTTILGRKRRIPELMSSEDSVRAYAERQAFNSLIQGSSADIIKLAMIRAHQTLDDDMRLVLTVHDELVTLVPEDKAERGKEIIHEAMCGPDISKLLRVPLKADIKVVQSWDEAK